MGWKTFLQLLKFGFSGIVGVLVSTLLFFAFKSKLPDSFLHVWIYRFDALEVAFYLVTSAIGGTVHFILSKYWVFD